MQYQPDAEKVGMVSGGGYQSGLQPVPLTQDPEVQRTRKTFIIILGVLLGLAAAGFILSLIGIAFGSAAEDKRAGAQLGQSLLTIIIYGLAITAAYKYSSLGLRIFGWFGIIGLVLIGISILAFIALAIMGAVAASSANDATSQGIFAGAAAFGFIFIILIIAAFILSIIIVRLAFKLARLIDANRRANPQQI